MNWKCASFALGLLLACGSAAATSLANAPVVFKSGNWSVLRSVDAMNDKTICVAIYKDDYGTQLTADTLYIHISGGPESYRFRFDDDPAGSMALTTPIDKKLDSIQVNGDNFRRLLAAHRLRYSTVTMIGNGVDGDLDVTGVAEAVQNISGGCAGNPLSGGIAPKSATPGCSEHAKERLKAKGMDDASIAEICAA